MQRGTPRVLGADLVRWVVPLWKHRESLVPIGVIGAAHELLDRGHMTTGRVIAVHATRRRATIPHGTMQPGTMIGVIVDSGSTTPAATHVAAPELVHDEVATELRRLLDWFDANLPVPKRFNRTRSKGWYRRATRGIAWLRSTATEHVTSMRKLAALVDRCGHTTTELRAHRVGYIVYEDELQVIAEPFQDTPVG